MSRTSAILKRYAVPDEARWITIEPGFELLIRPISTRKLQREIRRAALERGTETEQDLYLNEVEGWIATCLEGWRIDLGNGEVLEDYTAEEALQVLGDPGLDMHYTLAREKSMAWNNFRQDVADEEGKASSGLSNGTPATEEATGSEQPPH